MNTKNVTRVLFDFLFSGVIGLRKCYKDILIVGILSSAKKLQIELDEEEINEIYARTINILKEAGSEKRVHIE